jgi:hypothetical protein
VITRRGGDAPAVDANSNTVAARARITGGTGDSIAVDAAYGAGMGARAEGFITGLLAEGGKTAVKAFGFGADQGSPAANTVGVDAWADTAITARGHHTAEPHRAAHVYDAARSLLRG